MEAPRPFHPGKVAKLTKEQKRKREMQKLREKRRKERKSSYAPVEKRPRWFLLPSPIQHSFLIDTLSGDTFITKMKALQEYGQIWKDMKSDLFPSYKPDSKILESIRQSKTQCKKLIIDNQILRWKFKRFVTKWRLRRFRELNDTDCITLNPIVEAIRISNFALRLFYVFEASTLLSHIHRQLLHHDGSIPDPLMPKNPYTNELFSLGQLLNIRQQCKTKKESNWSLEAFAKSNYNIETFLQYNRKRLRMHAMKSILFSYKDYDGIDTLLNFIETQHDEHNAVFQKGLYRWCLMHIPEESRICKWRRLCLEYYEREILAEDDSGRDNAFFYIQTKTGTLCSPPVELTVKRQLFLRMKKDDSCVLLQNL
jgi:hypothetical protein